MEFEKENKERLEYWKMNLEPCIKLSLIGDINEKGWSACDMMFTYFLRTIMNIYHSHDLFMEHLQTWYRALMRDEGRDDFQLAKWGFDVPPRVRIAQKILVEFENARKEVSDPLLLNEKIYLESCDKPYNLFCVCLDNIVKKTKQLQPYLAEWDKYVVQGWFDYANNENARTFIARAELFFKKHGKSALQYHIALWNNLATSSSSSVFKRSNPYTVA